MMYDSENVSMEKTMKLSKNTINILHNFESINSAIVLNKGSELVTISKSETIFAKARIEEEIPRDVGIYDLKKFLGILSLNPECDIEFQDNFMLIKFGRSKIKYSYSEISTIMTPEKKDVKLPSVDVSFTLTTELLKEAMRAMAILKFSEIAFVGREGKLYLETLSTRNESSDVFSAEIMDTDRDFSVIIEADKLRMLELDYDVEICFAGLTHFKNPVVEYYIANSMKSEYE